MRYYAILLALMTSGCWSAETINASLARDARNLTGCDTATASMANSGMQTRMAVEGCGREWLCDYSVPLNRWMPCQETPRSAARTSLRIVIDRLSLETGCPPDQIALVSQSEWRVGTEQAYRLAACGKSYVCTLAAGRSECKPAL